MNYPLLAIRCTTYNHEKYIRQCLDGFVMQKTTFPFIAIVHDDASTDGTANVVREYEARYPEIIKPIYEIENQFSKRDGSLRKIMYEAVPKDVKYIAFCEGDDYWTDPLKLQKQVDYLESHPEIGACYTDCDIFYETENRWERAIRKNGYSVVDMQKPLANKGSYSYNVTLVYRKYLLDDDPYKFKQALDATHLMWLYMGLHAKFAGLDCVTGVYRRYSNSVSNKKNLKEEDDFSMQLYENIHLYIDDYYGVEDRKLRHAMLYGAMLKIALRNNDNNKLQDIRTKLFDLDASFLVGEIEHVYNIEHCKSYKIGYALLHPYQFIKNRLCRYIQK